MNIIKVSNFSGLFKNDLNYIFSLSCIEIDVEKY